MLVRCYSLCLVPKQHGVECNFTICFSLLCFLSVASRWMCSAGPLDFCLSLHSLCSSLPVLLEVSHSGCTLLVLVRNDETTSYSATAALAWEQMFVWRMFAWRILACNYVSYTYPLEKRQCKIISLALRCSCCLSSDHEVFCPLLYIEHMAVHSSRGLGRRSMHKIFNVQHHH